MKEKYYRFNLNYIIINKFNNEILYKIFKYSIINIYINVGIIDELEEKLR